jgi:hypothetical protein
MTQLATRKGMPFPLAPQNGSASDLLVSEESHRIREWLLGILRFAVTLEQCDRAALMGLAAEMDRLGAGTTQSGFTYFTRASTKLWDCIVVKQGLANLAELWIHLEQINDNRLRFALEGALFEKARGPTRSRKLDREYLWKGLAVR